jgi:hypothetical protein
VLRLSVGGFEPSVVHKPGSTTRRSRVERRSVATAAPQGRGPQARVIPPSPPVLVSAVQRYESVGKKRLARSFHPRRKTLLKSAHSPVFPSNRPWHPCLAIRQAQSLHIIW